MQQERAIARNQNKHYISAVEQEGAPTPQLSEDEVEDEDELSIVTYSVRVVGAERVRESNLERHRLEVVFQRNWTLFFFTHKTILRLIYNIQDHPGKQYC
jgi:hypothetical protein